MAQHKKGNKATKRLANVCQWFYRPALLCVYVHIVHCAFCMHNICAHKNRITRELYLTLMFDVMSEKKRNTHTHTRHKSHSIYIVPTAVGFLRFAKNPYLTFYGRLWLVKSAIGFGI